MDKPFQSDGCTLVKDFDMTPCCIVHDWAYYRGGTSKQRRQADKDFYRCIKQASRYKWLAPFRWLGVRIGGMGWLPISQARWGYGWKYPRTKAPEPDDSDYSVESQRPVYEQALAAARGRQARAQQA